MTPQPPPDEMNPPPDAPMLPPCDRNMEWPCRFPNPIEAVKDSPAVPRFNLSKDFCLKMSDLEGDATVGAGCASPAVPAQGGAVHFPIHRHDDHGECFCSCGKMWSECGTRKFDNPVQSSAADSLRETPVEPLDCHSAFWEWARREGIEGPEVSSAMDAFKQAWRIRGISIERELAEKESERVAEWNKRRDAEASWGAINAANHSLRNELTAAKQDSERLDHALDIMNSYLHDMGYSGLGWTREKIDAARREGSKPFSYPCTECGQMGIGIPNTICPICGGE